MNVRPERSEYSQNQKRLDSAHPGQTQTMLANPRQSSEVSERSLPTTAGRPSRLFWLPMILSLLVSGCQPQTNLPSISASEETAVALPKVATAKPQRITMIQKTVQPGQIEAFAVAPIHAKVGGFVDQLKADIGDHVTGPVRGSDDTVEEQGQVLAVLAAPELEEELRQKQAMVEQVRAEVLQAEAAVKVAISMKTSAVAGVDEYVAGQQRAAAQFEKARSEWERIRTLVEAKTVTEKLSEETELQYRSADASRTEADARLRSAEAALNEAEVAIEKSQADLEAVRATLRVAEADRDRVAALRAYLQIRAPFDGIITERHIDTGHLVQPSRGPQDQPLFVLIQADTVRIFIDVPEAEAALVEPGRVARILVSAFGNATFEGKVARTGWALQAGTRSLRCEIDVPNPDGKLRPGMYAQVDLTVAERPDALAVPKSAIVTQDGQAFCVTVSSDGTIVRKPVQTGIRSLTDIEIISGLDGSEDILTANAAAFTDGQKVERSASK